MMTWIDLYIRYSIDIGLCIIVTVLNLILIVFMIIGICYFFKKWILRR
jgi:hypothetical protein